MRFVGLIQCVIYYKTNIANLAFHLAIFLHRFRRALHIAGIVQEISAVFGRHDIPAQGDIVLVCHEYPHETDVYLGLLDAVQDGTIPMERVNESVRRIVKAKLLHAQS